jgi:hypothetical protein
MRRIIVSLSGLIAIAAALVSWAPSAFAMRVGPSMGGSPVDVAPAVHHSAGLAPWQIALIAVAGVIIGSAALLRARLARKSRRPATSAAAT